MKILKKIFIIIIIFIVIILIFAAFLPSTYKVVRTIEINSAKEPISGLIVDFKNWDKWSPWKNVDSTEKYIYNDTIGTGAFMSWTGKMIGTGNMKIINLSADSITYELNFKEPYESSSKGVFVLKNNNNKTNLTWINEGNLSWPVARLMDFFYDFDKMMGPDFEKGLAKIKETVESSPISSYTIIEKEVQSFTIATVRNKVSASEIEKTIGQSYASIQELIKNQSAKMIGPPMAITLAWDSTSWDFEAAIPIDKEIKGNAKVVVKKSYSGKVIYISYLGSYSKTYTAYNELEKYKNEKGYTDNGGPWEVYVTDPATEPDTSKWITEIYFPVK